MFVFLVALGIDYTLGVLLDTLVAGSVLVTALNLELRGQMWWPTPAHACARHRGAARSAQWRVESAALAAERTAASPGWTSPHS